MNLWLCRSWEAAKDMYERALEINPRSVESYAGLGWVHQMARNPALAIEFYHKASASLCARFLPCSAVAVVC